MNDKYDFFHEDKHQSFLQASVIIFAGHSKACQKYPLNSKFVISLQYLKNKRKRWSWFLHADKHETILQGDTINLDGHGQASPNYQK